VTPGRQGPSVPAAYRRYVAGVRACIVPGAAGVLLTAVVGLDPVPLALALAGVCLVDRVNSAALARLVDRFATSKRGGPVAPIRVASNPVRPLGGGRVPAS